MTMPPLSPYVCSYCKKANPKHKTFECPEHPDPEGARARHVRELEREIDELRKKITDREREIVRLRGSPAFQVILLAVFKPKAAREKEPRWHSFASVKDGLREQNKGNPYPVSDTTLRLCLGAMVSEGLLERMKVNASRVVWRATTKELPF